MTRKTRYRAIPLDSRPLARRLGCSYQTFIRRVGDFANGGRRTVWSFQAYGFIVFLRYIKHPNANCGVPRFYVINRYAAIHGQAGKVRARLRQKSPGQWLAYLRLIFKLAWGKIQRGRQAANDKHYASPEKDTVGGLSARPPPTKKKTNRAALRRFYGIACDVQRFYNGLSEAPRLLLKTWCAKRCLEGHSIDLIKSCLAEAVDLLPDGKFKPKNPRAWICAVAFRKLDGDGLGIKQRWWDRAAEAEQRQRASPATFNEEELDADWPDPTEKETTMEMRPGQKGEIGYDYVDGKLTKWECLGGTNWRKIDG